MPAGCVCLSSSSKTETRFFAGYDDNIVVADARPPPPQRLGGQQVQTGVSR